VGVLLVGVSGAIAALGDTLFPAQSLAHGLAQDLDPSSHALLHLRLYHPVIAIFVALVVAGAGWTAHLLRPAQVSRRHAVTLSSIVGLQLVAGMWNVVLLAPIWLQMVHLLLADLVWLALVKVAAEALAVEPEGAEATYSASEDLAGLPTR
jgi:cytochrome c oxidase assembly protein subunit 15